MEREQSGRYLPEELVEKIIAMMPFPSIFKAKTLSKSWLARFSSAGSEDDESKKQFASRFQTLVSERSHSWDTFQPFWIRPFDYEENKMYDWAEDRWRALPSTGFLWRSILTETDMLYFRSLLPKPNLSFEGNPQIVLNLHLEGALYLFCTCRYHPQDEDLYVANILTGSWKQLPPRPHADEMKIEDANTIIHTSPQTYIAVLFCRNVRQPGFTVQIYDSELREWSTKRLMNTFYFLSKPVYVNGVLYMVGDFCIPLAMRVENWTLEELEDEDLYIKASQAVGWKVCKGNQLIIVTGEDGVGVPDAIQVLGFDWVTRKFFEVTGGPPNTLGVGVFNPAPFTHGDSIHFGFEEDGEKVLQYNMKEDAWDLSHSHCYSSFSFEAGDDEWLDVMFQPGLNPFMPV